MIEKETLDEFKEEFEKGLTNLLLFGEEAYVIDKDTGKVRCCSEKEADEILQSGKSFSMVFDKDWGSIKKDFVKVYGEDCYRNESV